MAYSIRAARRYRSDYVGVIECLCEELGVPKTAAELDRAVASALDQLETNPYVRPVSHKEGLAERNFREYFVKGYEIVYEIQEDAVYLRRFLDQSQDTESKV